MKQPVFLSIAFATLIAPSFSQAPAAPAATTPPASTAPAEAPKVTKPLSTSDVRAITQIATAMQFFIKMGETGKWKGKEKYPEVAAFGTASHKAMVDLWTPMVNFAQERKVENKNIPPEVDKGDKASIDKLNKIKDEKWPAEYYELIAKEGKRYARSVETVVKGISDPDLKAMGETISKLIASQSEQAEVALKEAKKKK